MPTDDEFDLARLMRQDIPIVCFSQITLFEDELSDFGDCKCSVKLVSLFVCVFVCRHLPHHVGMVNEQRVMPDFFFVLYRYFLRVDGVIARVVDARYFHDFSMPYMLCETCEREKKFADYPTSPVIID